MPVQTTAQNQLCLWRKLLKIAYKRIAGERHFPLLWQDVSLKGMGIINNQIQHGGHP